MIMEHRFASLITTPSQAPRELIYLVSYQIELNRLYCQFPLYLNLTEFSLILNKQKLFAQSN